jgi:hemerythrin
VRFQIAKESTDYLEVLDQLKDWLFMHMEHSDKEFVAHLKATGVESILAAWNEPK